MWVLAFAIFRNLFFWPRKRAGSFFISFVKSISKHFISFVQENHLRLTSPPKSAQKHTPQNSQRFRTCVFLVGMHVCGVLLWPFFSHTFQSGPLVFTMAVSKLNQIGMRLSNLGVSWFVRHKPISTNNGCHPWQIPLACFCVSNRSSTGRGEGKGCVWTS